jgi:hypothetical protein
MYRVHVYVGVHDCYCCRALLIVTLVCCAPVTDTQGKAPSTEQALRAVPYPVGEQEVTQP